MFEAKFYNPALFKKIVEAIKDLVTEAPIDCTENALCLEANDESNVALISLKLPVEVSRFERPTSMGVSLNELSKILKCSKNEDTCMIRLEEDGDIALFVFQDEDNRQQILTLKLLDVEPNHIEISNQGYDCRIDMPSSEFQKVCRDISSFSDTLRIVATRERVVFEGEGDAVKNTIVYPNKNYREDEEKRVEFTVNENVNVSFSMRYIMASSKGSVLAKRVRICLAKRGPILVEYGIEENGFLRFYLAQKIQEDDMDSE